MVGPLIADYINYILAKSKVPNKYIVGGIGLKIGKPTKKHE